MGGGGYEETSGGGGGRDICGGIYEDVREERGGEKGGEGGTDGRRKGEMGKGKGEKDVDWFPVREGVKWSGQCTQQRHDNVVPG